jgi:hypothetical protein
MFVAETKFAAKDSCAELTHPGEVARGVDLHDREAGRRRRGVAEIGRGNRLLRTTVTEREIRVPRRVDGELEVGGSDREPVRLRPDHMTEFVVVRGNLGDHAGRGRHLGGILRVALFLRIGSGVHACRRTRRRRSLGTRRLRWACATKSSPHQTWATRARRAACLGLMLPLPEREELAHWTHRGVASGAHGWLRICRFFQA